MVSRLLATLSTANSVQGFSIQTILRSKMFLDTSQSVCENEQTAVSELVVPALLKPLSNKSNNTLNT